MQYPQCSPWNTTKFRKHSIPKLAGRYFFEPDLPNRFRTNAAWASFDETRLSLISRITSLAIIP